MTQNFVTVAKWIGAPEGFTAQIRQEVCFLIYQCLLTILRFHVLKLMGVIKGLVMLYIYGNSNLNKGVATVVRDLGKKDADPGTGSYATT